MEWIEKDRAEAQEKARNNPIPAVPQPKTFENFEYHDQGERDPFAPSLEDQQTEANVANGPMPNKHPPEKLEQYALDSLKMVGTVGSGASLEGLIKDPDGTVTRVHRGSLYRAEQWRDY